MFDIISLLFFLQIMLEVTRGMCYHNSYEIGLLKPTHALIVSCDRSTKHCVLRLIMDPHYPRQ